MINGCFILHIFLHRRLQPGDLTVNKRTGTSNRIEIQFRTFNHLSCPDSFAKLFETLCLCLAQGNEYLGQIWDRNTVNEILSNFKPEMDFYFTTSARPFPSSEITLNPKSLKWHVIIRISPTPLDILALVYSIDLRLILVCVTCTTGVTRNWGTCSTCTAGRNIARLMQDFASTFNSSMWKISMEWENLNLILIFIR